MTAPGGMIPRPPADLRSPFLQQQGAAVAERSAERALARHPELAERFGGRAGPPAVEDQHWALGTLDAALSVGDPAVFLRFADWFVRFLAPRGIGREAVATLLRELAEAMQEAPCPADLQAHRSVLVRTARDAADHVAAPSSAHAAAS